MPLLTHPFRVLEHEIDVGLVFESGVLCKAANGSTSQTRMQHSPNLAHSQSPRCARAPWRNGL